MITTLLGNPSTTSRRRVNAVYPERVSTKGEKNRLGRNLRFESGTAVSPEPKIFVEIDSSVGLMTLNRADHVL